MRNRLCNKKDNLATTPCTCLLQKTMNITNGTASSSAIDEGPFIPLDDEDEFTTMHDWQDAQNFVKVSSRYPYCSVLVGSRKQIRSQYWLVLGNKVVLSTGWHIEATD